MIYNEQDPKQILEYARRLEKNTIRETNTVFETNEGAATKSTSPKYMGKDYQGKGSFGQVLEEQYFGKKNDSVSQPDFPKAKMELKASPLKRLKNNQIRVKERLVLNLFTYMDIDKETFGTSHFKMKDTLILLVFYFYDNSLNPLDMTIDLVDIWECLKEDERQIRQDWEDIVKKVHDGKAEEISEGDTLYLGACTKGTTTLSSMQRQPHSDVLARGRALCFKTSYINHIYNVLKAKGNEREQRFVTKKDATFEETIATLFNPCIGMTGEQIQQKLGIKVEGKAKYAIIARMILGFNRKGMHGKRFYEFDAADIQVKSIRIEKNGGIRENISFKPIQYKELVTQDWEDSDLYQELTSKFIFAMFRKTDDDSDYYLSGYRFWNMPEKDLEVAGQEWFRTKAAILRDDFSDMPKMRDHKVIHVRPHAKNKLDEMETPSGRMEYKRSFWLNRDYVMKTIAGIQ